MNSDSPWNASRSIDKLQLQKEKTKTLKRNITKLQEKLIAVYLETYI